MDASLRPFANTMLMLIYVRGVGGLWRMVLGEMFLLSAYIEKENTQKNTISSMVLFQTPVWSRHYGHVNTCSVLSTPPATLLLPNQTSSSQYLFWNCNSFRLFGWQLGCRDGGFLAGLLFSLFYGVCVGGWGGGVHQISSDWYWRRCYCCLLKKKKKKKSRLFYSWINSESKSSVSQ